MTARTDQASPRSGASFALNLPPQLLHAVAVALADELERRGVCAGAVAASPWLDVDEAASYLRASRQRVYDLVHSGSLAPGRDGRRLLFRRETLDTYLAGASSILEEAA